MRFLCNGISRGDRVLSQLAVIRITHKLNQLTILLSNVKNRFTISENLLQDVSKICCSELYLNLICTTQSVSNLISRLSYIRVFLDCDSLERGFATSSLNQGTTSLCNIQFLFRIIYRFTV
jgi:hypothetical protein